MNLPDSPPALFAAWIACAAFAVLLTNELFKLVKNLLGRSDHAAAPQPFEIKAATEFSTKKDVDRVLTVFAAHEVEDKKSFGEIYDKIDAMRKEAKEDLHEQTSELASQINHMPAQLITILRNSGAIGK